jgi:anti-anti-sigma factor
MSKSITVVIDGDIVAGSVEQIKKELLAHKESDASEVLLDLQTCQIVDSTGIGLLVAAYNSFKQLGKSIQIKNASQDIQQMFKMMRLDSHFGLS